MLPEKTNCTNCGAEGVQLYCPNCGQKRVEGRLTFTDLKTDGFATLLYIERRFILTIKDLLSNPRKLIESFSSGHRKRYAIPFQFFLFFLTIYLLLYSIFEREIFENLELSFGGETEAEQKSSQEIAQDIRDTLARFMNYLYFLLPPFIALFARLFFKKVLNYAEALVLAFYVESINLCIALVFLLAPMNETYSSVKSILSILLFAYIFSFFSKKRIVGALKGVLVLLFGMICFSGIIGAGIFLIVWQKGLV